MTRAIIDTLVGVPPGKGAALQEDSESSLTATESRVFVRLLGRSITSTLDRVFSRLFGDRGSAEILLSADHPAFGPKSFDASEQLVTTQARCTINQVSGCFTLGLPMSVVYQIRAKLVPPLVAGANRSPEGTRNVAALTAVPIEMQALLGRRTMLFSQVRKLKVGSVVLLQKLERELPKVEMRAAGQLLFRGTIVDDHGWHNFLIQQIGDRDGQRAAE
jgi:flagellar motor switch protein FliM